MFTLSAIDRAPDAEAILKLAAQLPAPHNTIRTGRSSALGHLRHPAPSIDTMRAELRLRLATATGKSTRTRDRLRVLHQLNELRDAGVVKTMIQRGGMARPYLLEARGFRGERAYTLSELEAFVHGADAALDR